MRGFASAAVRKMDLETWREHIKSMPLEVDDDEGEDDDDEYDDA